MTSTAPKPNNASTEEPEPLKPDNFPPDLLAKQRALSAAYAALHAFSADPELPWAATPHDGRDDTSSGRWRETVREETDGWTDEQQAEHDRLWAEVRKRAIEVSYHNHCGVVREYCGPKVVVKARQALKQAALKPLDVVKAA